MCITFTIDDCKWENYMLELFIYMEFSCIFLSYILIVSIVLFLISMFRNFIFDPIKKVKINFNATPCFINLHENKKS